MILALVEGVLLFVAVAGTTLFWGRPLPVNGLDALSLIWQAGLPSVCCIVAFYYNDLYDLRIVQSFGEFTSRLLQSFGVALILLAAIYTVFPEMRISRGPLLSSLLLIVGLLVPLRSAGYSFMRRHTFAERVLILGTGPLAQTLIDLIDPPPHFPFKAGAVAG